MQREIAKILLIASLSFIIFAAFFDRTRAYYGLLLLHGHNFN